jgi:O-antigen ligase
MMMRIFAAPVLLFYSIAVLTSMAAMEITAWLALALAISVVVSPRIKSWREIRLGGMGLFNLDAWAAIFLVGAVVGGMLQSRSPWWQVAGEARWVFLLYGFSILLRNIPLKSWHKGLRGFCFVIILAGLYSLVQFFFGVEFFHAADKLEKSGNFWRAIGFFSLPLSFAASIAMTSAIAGGLYITAPRGRLKALTGVAAALGTVGLLTSLTRGVWAGMAFALAGVALVIGGRRALIPIAIGATGVTILATFNSSIANKIIHTFNFSATTYTDRYKLWAANWEIFKDHPFFGVGYGQSYLYLTEYAARMGIDSIFISHAHNVYVQMLSATGAVGLTSFVGLSICFVIYAWRLWSNVPRSHWQVRGFAVGALVALLTLHIAGMSESNFTDAEVNHLTIFIWANLAALESRRRKGEFTV